MEQETFSNDALFHHIIPRYTNDIMLNALTLEIDFCNDHPPPPFLWIM